MSETQTASGRSNDHSSRGFRVAGGQVFADDPVEQSLFGSAHIDSLGNVEFRRHSVGPLVSTEDEPWLRSYLGARITLPWFDVKFVIQYTCVASTSIPMLPACG